MHPNEKGIETMVAKFLPMIEKNLKDIQKTGTSGG